MKCELPHCKSEAALFYAFLGQLDLDIRFDSVQDNWNYIEYRCERHRWLNPMGSKVYKTERGAKAAVVKRLL